MRITSGGKIGFNNSSPQYQLHVKSNSTSASQRIDLHMTNDTTGHTSGDGCQFGYQNTAGAYIWNFENTPIYFGTNNNERVRIHADGTFAVKNGIFLDPGQLSGSSNNILDEYEEGTFTPSIRRTGSQPTATHSNQTGSYTKIGRLVLVWFDMTMSALSGGSGTYQIQGLPFPAVASSNSGGYGSPQFRNCTAWNYDAHKTPSCYHDSTKITLRYQSAKTVENDISVTTGRITGWSVYFTNQ